MGVHEFEVHHFLKENAAEEFSENWGDGRGSNPRQPESQSGTLPTELPPPLKNIELNGVRHHLIEKN